jgi:hypothetical protein
METILMSLIILIAFLQSIRVICLKRKLYEIESTIRKSENISPDI